ncbi:VOC family protein [Streptomyces sp. 184]|uniref:VOC family protein n=1 Tax=Streptomyces sp. 184 TaxID=1827526 RepID=UPI00389285A5
MTVRPEGAPCWADATFPDLDSAKSFYADVFGWTFEDGGEAAGHYTQASADSGVAAGLAPPMPGTQDAEADWMLYFATPDAAATAGHVGEHGGRVVTGPMEVGSYGTMAIAEDPDGIRFGLWQSGSHEGFAAIGEPGTFCWAEVDTRNPEHADAFFPEVFGYRVRRMQDDTMDYAVWSLGDGDPLLGRAQMSGNVFPAGTPPHVGVCFAVDDCDRAVETTERRGGSVTFGPQDSPFGRMATLKDPQGASFTVINVNRTVGEMPEFA